ncbi:MAG: hypothetical protein IJI57_10640 [Flexilinea sp.]|nr:hypothetical protein [Flexilinea sp.]
MELYIDDADLKEICRLYELYPIDGVTTNPSILAKTGRNPVQVLKEIRSALGSEAVIFAQVIPTDVSGMVRDAHALVSLLGDRTVVKIPSIPEGFRAIRDLSAEGIRTCGTVVYTPLQAYLAAKSGAAYVAPYINRIDNMGFDGVGMVKKMQDILDLHEYDTKILAASFKNSQQALDLCTYGIKAATCAPSVIDGFVNNAAIDSAVRNFVADFLKVSNGKASVAELIG